MCKVRCCDVGLVASRLVHLALTTWSTFACDLGSNMNSNELLFAADQIADRIAQF